MPARFQAEIKAEHLRAMLHLAGDKDVRYYLNGVLLIAEPEVRLVATNGTIIGVLRTGQLAGSRFQIRVPRETLKQMGKLKGQVVVASEDGWHWTLKAGALQLAWKAETEAYPQWWRAIPQQTSGEATLLDPALVAIFLKVAADLDATMGPRTVLVGQNGTGNALISMPAAPDFIGVIAPMVTGSSKHPDPVTRAPDFATAEPMVPAEWREAQPETADDLV